MANRASADKPHIQSDPPMARWHGCAAGPFLSEGVNREGTKAKGGKGAGEPRIREGTKKMARGLRGDYRAAGSYGRGRLMLQLRFIFDSGANETGTSAASGTALVPVPLSVRLHFSVPVRLSPTFGSVGLSVTTSFSTNMTPCLLSNSCLITARYCGSGTAWHMLSNS